MLPQLLTSRLEFLLGSDYQSVMEALSQERKGSFRINTLKKNAEAVFQEFTEKGIVVEKFDSIEGAYFFDRTHEFAIKGTRAFYDGDIYLQGLSSMIPVIALDPKMGETVLDICAAPGSKTTQMAALMHNNGKIVAIEQNQIRFDKLMHNCKLQGATIVEGVKLDAKKYFAGDFEVSGEEIHKKGKYAKYRESDHYAQDPEKNIPEFDRILLDAPCSAEGRINTTNEKSYGFWTLDNITKKADLQYELLSTALENLKSGGTLVYSTCTLAPEENEGVITRALKNNTDIKIQDITLGLSGQKWWKKGITEFGKEKYHPDMTKTIRILPSEDTEGFFIAKLVKR